MTLTILWSESGSLYEDEYDSDLSTDCEPGEDLSEVTDSEADESEEDGY